MHPFGSVDGFLTPSRFLRHFFDTHFDRESNNGEALTTSCFAPGGILHCLVGEGGLEPPKVFRPSDLQSLAIATMRLSHIVPLRLSKSYH